MRIEGVIQLENAIPVVFESLNKEFPINVSGIKGTLATPVPREDFFEVSNLDPLLKPKNSQMKFEPDFRWGRIHQWPLGAGGINAVSIWFDVIEDFENVGQKIVDVLPEWRELLIDNFSVVAENDLREPKHSKTLILGGAGQYRLQGLADGKWRDFPTTKFPALISRIGTTWHLEVEDLKKVLENTSNGSKPRLPFYFLLDASRAIYEENYRKSVLDSATALEVCFSYVIKNNLNIDNALKEYIIKKNDGLFKKRELLKAIDISLPRTDNEYAEHLERVRNLVIHAGQFPSRKAALQAYDISKETINTLFVDKFECQPSPSPQNKT